MHILFIHQNFPAQFGHIADYLIKQKGFRCTFASQKPAGYSGGIERIQYHVRGGATDKNHYCSRTFENSVWHSHALYEALHSRPDVKPDLIVAHSGFLSTIFLRELYDCPLVNYFEYFYRTKGSDMDFRPDFPSPSINCLRARARNATLLLDLENCDAGYSPTRWQRERLPKIFHDKVRVVFDGVDTNLWKPLPGRPRTLGNREVPDGMKVVTYVSRGMESMRGFDIFMKAARLLCQRRQDVLFVVVGQDRVCYGGDKEVTGSASFKDWVLSRDDYDLSRFVFTGLLPTPALAELFSLSDLHIYLTVPFVLSWSLMDALACGATVLASDTGPVREMIEHGKNGLLTDFFDVERLADTASKVLDAPQEYRHLGAAGVEMIRAHYSLEVCLPQMLQLYEDALAAWKAGSPLAAPTG
ncbi:MAG TPA: glycosyltransferase [Gemmataceae bacterium]|nr:glycosyltransferase [Gemmataceae bacterium]